MNWAKGLSSIGEGIADLPIQLSELEKIKLQRELLQADENRKQEQYARDVADYDRNQLEESNALKAISEMQDKIRQSELPASIPMGADQSLFVGAQGGSLADIANIPIEFPNIAIGNTEQMSPTPESLVRSANLEGAGEISPATFKDDYRRLSGKSPTELFKSEGLSALGGLPLVSSQSKRAKDYMGAFPKPIDADKTFDNQLSFEKLKLDREKYLSNVEQKNKENDRKNKELYLDNNYKHALIDKIARDLTKEKDNKYTSDQTNAATFSVRMEQAENDLSRLSSMGFNPASFSNKILTSDQVNAIKDPNQRMYAQSVRNFITAVLRKESGAAISPSEFETAYAQYFAQLGDDSATLEQKRKTRLAALSGIRTAAGKAYDDTKKRYLEALKLDKSRASELE